MAPVTLRLMATSDVHMHLLGYDYYADGVMDGVGLTRIATLLHAARHEVANSLYFDNGDLLQGNPMGDVVAADATEPHPAYLALAEMGCDVATLGNHEFNYGLDALDRALGSAPIPLVCANVMREGAAMLPPTIVLERHLRDVTGRAHPIRIGVTGVCPPQIMMWDKRHLDGRVTCRDMVEAVGEAVASLRTRADLVIVLCHSGLDQTDWTPGMENALAPVSRIPGIDAIIAGHRHGLIPSDDTLPDGRINGVPVVMPGFWGSHLGIIDLTLDRKGGWRVVDARAELRATVGVPEDEDIARLLAPVHARTLDHARRVVGHTSVPLHSFFAQVRPDIGLALVADAQASHVRAALSASQWGSLPVLSAVAAFKMGGRGGPGYFTDIPAGPMTLSGISDLYVFPNEIRAVAVTGRELHLWLERAAGRYVRIRPGQVDQALFDPDHDHIEMDVIHGVNYEIDLSVPPMFAADGTPLSGGGQRIRRLAIDGRPVAAEDRFVVATNNYRAGGGGIYPGADGSTEIYAQDKPVRDLLIEHVAANGVSTTSTPDWRFSPLGATAIFPSGPGGRSYLGTCPEIEDTGRTEAGFALFRINI